MQIAPKDGFRKTCVLPFEAAPAQLAHLRRAVALQLITWNVEHLTEVAKLAVTELATNVVKHVGPGSPATLILETSAECLRIELHDTSKVLPCRRQASPIDETGRGLSILAGVSDGWFAVATPGGKAVCCEFLYVEAAKKLQPCGGRITRGLSVVELYLLQWGTQNTRPRRGASVIEAAAADLITDLMFCLADNGFDPDDILDRAQTYFEAELGGA